MLSEPLVPRTLEEATALVPLLWEEIVRLRAQVHAVVTEHQLQQVRCAACGTTPCAVLPADVPPGAFGPRLQATVAVLSGRYRLSRREVVGVCTDVLGAPLAVGSVDRLCQATA